MKENGTSDLKWRLVDNTVTGMKEKCRNVELKDWMRRRTNELKKDNDGRGKNRVNEGDTREKEANIVRAEILKEKCKIERVKPHQTKKWKWEIKMRRKTYEAKRRWNN